MRWQAERPQSARVQVALGDEEHALARGMLPFSELSALDADRAGALAVGELEEVQRLVAVFADEHDDRALLERLGVAVEQRGPAGDEVVVAAELRRVLRWPPRPVHLDEDVDAPCAFARRERELDQRVGLKVLELLPGDVNV